jgi:hypothetical protein
MEKTSFIFYRSFHESLKDLSDKDQFLIMKAINNYIFEGIMPNLKGISKTCFILIKPQLDASSRNYENGKKGAVYGKNGGRPRQENNPPPLIENNAPLLETNNPNYNKELELKSELELELKSELERKRLLKEQAEREIEPRAGKRDPFLPPALNQTNEELFKEFWEAYPKKIDYAFVKKEYLMQLQEGESHEKMLKGAKEYKVYRGKINDPQMTTNGVKWLQAKKWNDVLKEKEKEDNGYGQNRQDIDDEYDFRKYAVKQ